MFLQRMTQRHGRLQAVLVLAAHAFAAKITGGLQIGHNPLHRSFGNTDFRRDVSQSDVLPDRQAEEDVGVVA